MTIYSASLKGLRKNNEDKHTIYINLNNKIPDEAPVNLYGIYDGHGYSNGGKTVSTYLADNIPQFFKNKLVKYPLNKTFVERIFKYVQNGLINKHKILSSNSGSTCLLICHYKGKTNEYIDVINLGDSRCVLCRSNRAIPLTKDHKPNYPEERSRIYKLGGNPTFDGRDWRIGDLSVSRSFGDQDTKQYITCIPDVFKYKINKNDKFIVLACDGLWDVMDSQTVVNFILEKCYDVEGKFIEKDNYAKKLAEHAIRLGSHDNVSVIIVFF